LYSFFSPVSDECNVSDKLLVCYIETHSDDPQKFRLHMDLTLGEGYWISFYVKLVTVISHDIYYSDSIALLVNWYNNKIRPLIGQVLLIPNIINVFMDISQ
jgi:hypothetical protein